MPKAFLSGGRAPRVRIDMESLIGSSGLTESGSFGGRQSGSSAQWLRFLVAIGRTGGLLE